MARVEFAHYFVGEGKGDDGSLPEMFTADESSGHAVHEGNTAFARKWLSRDRSIDADQIGFDGKRWPLSQAYCLDIMRRELPEEPRHYRIIVSPEKAAGDQLDMQEFGKELIARVESDYSRQFYWVASAHHNTDHPHLHIGIRGMDTKMEPVLIHPPYRRTGIRNRAREILYERLGSAKELRRAG
jgi:hypothetical protein